MRVRNWLYCTKYLAVTYFNHSSSSRVEETLYTVVVGITVQNLAFIVLYYILCTKKYIDLLEPMLRYFKEIKSDVPELELLNVAIIPT